MFSLKRVSAIVLAIAVMLTMIPAALAADAPIASFELSKANVYEGDVFEVRVVVTNAAGSYAGSKAVFTYNAENIALLLPIYHWAMRKKVDFLLEKARAATVLLKLSTVAIRMGSTDKE